VFDWPEFDGGVGNFACPIGIARPKLHGCSVAAAIGSIQNGLSARSSFERYGVGSVGGTCMVSSASGLFKLTMSLSLLSLFASEKSLWSSSLSCVSSGLLLLFKVESSIGKLSLLPNLCGVLVVQFLHPLFCRLLY
jgi:hypothetical protein